MSVETHVMAIAYGLVIELAIALGVPQPLGGLWTCDVDGRWEVALNGGDEPVDWCGFSVPRFMCAVAFNGWPAGLFGPFGGTLAAGRVANEESLCEALRTKIAAHDANAGIVWARPERP